MVGAYALLALDKILRWEGTFRTLFASAVQFPISSFVKSSKKRKIGLLMAPRPGLRASQRQSAGIFESRDCQDAFARSVTDVKWLSI